VQTNPAIKKALRVGHVLRVGSRLALRLRFMRNARLYAHYKFSSYYYYYYCAVMTKALHNEARLPHSLQYVWEDENELRC